MSNPTPPITIRFLHLSALPLVVIAGALAGACGGEAGTTGTTGSGGSASTTTGSTSTTTSTTGTTTSTTGTGGAAMNPDPCDPLAQDCVEATASKCTTHWDDANALTTVCEAPLGDQKLGQSCVRPTGEIGVDTCDKGLFCAFYGSPASNPQERTCHTLCDTEGSCGQGKECIGVRGNEIGVCAEGCAPYTGACGAGTSCVPMTSVGGHSSFTCSLLGTKAAYDPCADTTECSADMTCRTAGAGTVCSPYCNDTHLCGDPNGHCSSFTDFLSPPGWGSCIPSDYACLGSVVWDPPMNAKESVQIVVFNAYTGDVLPGAKVKVCAANDAPCAAPLAQATSGADGGAKVDVPTVGAGFDGYFEVSLAGKLTELVYTNAPIAGPGAVLSGALVSLADFESSIKGPAVADPARGQLFTLALDCSGASAGGAAFTVSTADAASVIAHALPSAEYVGVVPNIFDPALTSSSVGMSFGLNIPAGMATVSAQVPGPQALGSKAVQIRAGALTFITILPAP